MLRKTLSYIVLPGCAFVVGVSAAAVVGGFGLALTVAFLAVLEVSLSFDNATVNATVLQNWPEHRRSLFIWIGLPIAVFGMRLVFPALIVAAIAHITPWEAGRLALYDATTYATYLGRSHVAVSAFGGTFLLALGLRYFIDADKDQHWIPGIERLLGRFAVVPLLDVALTLSALGAIDAAVNPSDRLSFLNAGVWGIVVFVASRTVGVFASGGSRVVVAGIGGLLYLEVLDASFSFDGVLGAFALTNQVVWIAVGLGIGALSVRELTLLAVDRGTLTEFPYLENGAFWSILCLALLMLLAPVIPIPQYVTGGLGALLIGSALVSSIVVNRRALTSAVGAG